VWQVFLDETGILRHMESQDRRLSEKQVREILRRAAELQESRGAELVQLGPTTADVQKIGEELGMDPACLRTAIEEVLSGQTEAKSGFWGGPVVMQTERVYQSELTDDDWHEILSEMRTLFGRTGSVSEVAGAREWDGSRAVLDPIHVSARSKSGSTKVTLKSDLWGNAFLLGLSTFFPLFISTMVLTQLLSLGSAELGIAAGIFGAAGLFYRKTLGWMATRRAKAISALDAKIQEVTERVPAAPTTQAEEEARVQIKQ
jgi:hypothetical protein